MKQILGEFRAMMQLSMDQTESLYNYTTTMPMNCDANTDVYPFFIPNEPIPPIDDASNSLLSDIGLQMGYNEDVNLNYEGELDFMPVCPGNVDILQKNSICASFPQGMPYELVMFSFITYNFFYCLFIYS